MEFTYDSFIGKLSEFVGLPVEMLVDMSRKDQEVWDYGKTINLDSPQESFRYYNRLNILCVYIKWHFILSAYNRENLSKKLVGDVLNFGCGLATENLMAAERIRSYLYDLPTTTFRFTKYVVETESIPNVTFLDRVDANASYDTIVCTDVLEHLQDPRGYLKMFKGMLRPNGKLLVRAPFYIQEDPSHIQDHALKIEDLLKECKYEESDYEVVSI